MIDSHCHLDSPAFDADRDEVLARAAAHGVTGFVVPAMSPATWPKAIALATQYHSAGWRMALGCHPYIVPTFDAETRRGLTEQALAAGVAQAQAQHPDLLVAIGECGLDNRVAEPAEQARVFRLQLRVARSFGLPVILHILRAHDAALQILREERVTDVGGVLHSYSGSIELLASYAKLGLAFGFAASVCHPEAKRPRAVAAQVPADLLLLETDAPDQPARELHGKRNEPMHLPRTAAVVAELRGLEVCELQATTRANALRIFARW